MGNSESKDGPPSSSPDSVKQATLREATRRADRPLHSHSLSHGARKVSSTPTPPPTTHLVTPNAASTSTSTEQAHGAVSSSPKRVHTRARSTTTGTHKLHPQELSLSHKSAGAAMGNAESKQSPIRPPSRSNTLPTHTKAPRSATPSSALAAEETTPPSPPSRAVDVPPHPPSIHDGAVETIDQDDYIPSGYSQSPYGLPPANYSRPPRLPLPIEEEVHAPGSPILSPSDITSPLDSSEIEAGGIPRKSSVLSSITLDDEDNAGEYDAFAEDPYQTKVPTKLEWKEDSDSVFVTGTFCNWEKKYKMQKNKDGTPGFSLTVPLAPGTHHLKFLVGNEMIINPDMPTTVEWANILVNYIEVLAPPPSATEEEKQPPAPAQPMPIPGAAATEGQTTGTDLPATIPVSSRPTPETVADLPSTLQETVDGKDETKPAAPIPIQATPTPRQQSELPQPESKPKAAAPKAKLPRPRYTSQIPEFLIDLDNYSNPEDERYQRAQKLASTLPQPPSLPMFLSKSILNGATPHKDDASVLIMPNHTVLNHLATSSIKSGVLATSGTTRYKRKFLTTIMYKPTSDDG